MPKPTPTYVYEYVAPTPSSTPSPTFDYDTYMKNYVRDQMMQLRAQMERDRMWERMERESRQWLDDIMESRPWE